jgi:streptogramin lyase
MSNRLPVALASLLAAAAVTGSADAAQPVLFGQITEWNLNPSYTGASWIDVDLDNSLWFTDQFTLGVGHFDPVSGELREWFLPGGLPATATDGIAADGLGRAYFATPAYGFPITNAIRRIDASPAVAGNLTTWVIPGNIGAFLVDNWNTGNLFFTEYTASTIGMLNVSGGVDGFGVPASSVVSWTIPGASLPEDVSVAPNMRVYFTEDGGHKIAELDPGSDTIREWAIPAAAAGNDRLSLRVNEGRCLAANDCELWFISQNANQVQRLNTKTHIFTRWNLPTLGCQPAGGASCLGYGLDIDAVGRVWISQGIGYLWVLDPKLTAGTNTLVPDALAPLGNTPRSAAVAVAPSVMHVDPEITPNLPSHATSPATLAGGPGFSGWPVSAAASKPSDLQLDGQDRGWFANYGDPPGFGRLTISVNQPPSPLVAPVAAGVPGAPIQLDASASTDVEGDAITFAWELARPDGSLAVLSSTDIAAPSFTPDVAGDYTVTLTLTDAVGAISDPVVQVIHVLTPVCLDLRRGPPGTTVGDAQIAHKYSPVLGTDTWGSTRYGTTAPLAGAVGGLTVPNQPNTKVSTKLLLRFDVSTIPAQATVLSAELRVWAQTTTPGQVNLSRVLLLPGAAAWDEKTVSWNSLGNAQETAVQQSLQTGPAGSSRWMVFDSASVTAMSQGWVDGAPNNGVILSGETTLRATFATSESALLPENHQPLLHLCYLPQ